MARKTRQTRRVVETQALRVLHRRGPRAALRVLADAGLGQPARTLFLIRRVRMDPTEAQRVA